MQRSEKSKFGENKKKSLLKLFLVPVGTEAITCDDGSEVDFASFFFDLSKNLTSSRGDILTLTITLPLAGMFGGGSLGSLGGVSVTLLSSFCLVSFLCALGDELDELLELVTVSPELHGRGEVTFEF